MTDPSADLGALDDTWCGSTDGASGEPVVGVPELDRFADAVRARLGVPVALVSLVQTEHARQAFPGMAGDLPEPYGSHRQTPLTHSLCRYVVHDRGPLVISDTRQDLRLRGNPAIEELGVVAYAGFPLRDATGEVVGSLCAIDHAPRTWTESELAHLEHLADGCSTQLQQLQRRGAPVHQRRPGPARAEDPHTGERSRLLLALSEALAETLDVGDVAAAVSDASIRHLGCLRAGLWLRQSDLPRAQTGLPEGVAASHDTLCWARRDDAGWLRASSFACIALDGSTPVGRAAATSEAVYYDSRAAQNEDYPLLIDARQEGERRAFLPLVNRGRLFGALALVWDDVGPVSEEQRATITALASYASQALERASLRQERTDALVALQRALIPVLPTTEEVELRARYQPASSRDQVGGDWYDALVAEPGCLEVMVGDVVGHDLTAAASMGQIRTMLRVIATTTDDGPAAQVARLDRAIVDLDVTGMATLVHGRVRRLETATGSSPGAPDDVPARWEFVWTNAGHPPPVALLPDGEVRWLDQSPVDVLLGVTSDTPRHEHRVVLPAGTTLLLYTDGLVERRGETLQVGLSRLGVSLAHHGTGSLDELLDGVLGDLVGDSGADDVAVLGVRL